MDTQTRDKMVKQLVGQTDGFTCVELDSVLDLCKNQPLQEAINRVYAYRHGRKDNPWSKISSEQILGLEKELSKRINECKVH